MGERSQLGARRATFGTLPSKASPDTVYYVLYAYIQSLWQAYSVPQAAQLSRREDKQVSYFLLFREQVHDGPLYTQARTRNMNTNEPGRVYGQDQINKRYGVKNQATVDPFLAMPTYSQRFTKQERSLPDLASRPFAKEFFPRELHETLEGTDGPGGAKRRRMTKKTLALSNITSLRTAEEIFLPEAAQQELADAEGQNKALQLLDKINDGEGGVDNIDLEDDDDWVQSTNVGDGDDDDAAEDSDQYDDESGDDYNAEQYFEENQPDDDYGDGDGGGEDFF